MKAIVFQGVHDARVEQVPDASLRGDRSAVVRVTRASICGSDLHVYHGAVPGVPGTIMGHECVGVVEELGMAVRRFRKGDRVIVPAVVGCGDCEPCRRGYPVGCDALPVKVYGILPDLPGAQAEAVTVPNADANLWPAPADLSDEQILFLTDILPTGYFAAEGARLQPGCSVVVIGCGPVGLCAVLCAQLFGPAKILAVDRVPHRLEQARAFGAVPVDTAREDVKVAVLEATGGRGAHAVIEAVGTQETARLAFDLVRTGGAVSMVGVLIRDDFTFPMGTAFMKDIAFRVGLVNVQRTLPALIPLVQAGRIDPTVLISHRLPLSEGKRAYELFDRREDGCLKVVLIP